VNNFGNLKIYYKLHMKIKTLFSAAILHTAFLFPYSGSWVITNLTGNWSTAADWTPAGGPPQVAGDTAIFPSAGASTVTVTVDMPTFVVGTLSFPNPPNNYTIAGSGTNSLNLTGSAGTVAITGSGSGASNDLISVPLVLTNPLTITLSSANLLTISGVMSGPGSLTTAGAGTTVITGANTYIGGTTVPVGQLNCNGAATIPASGTLTISGGTVQCNIAGALNPAGAVNITSGTLNINNLNQAIGSLSGTGGTITLGTATLTSNTSTATTYSGTMTGSGGFTLAGSGGTLTLGTSPAYTGTTTVNGSTLFLNPGVTLPSGGNVTVNGPGVLNLNNNNQLVGVLSGAGAGSIILGSGALSTNSTTAATFAGVISGTGSFTQAGTSTQTFTGNNTYTGGTTINSGATLQLGINNALASTGPVTIGGGTLDLTPAASTQQAIGPLTSMNGASTIHLGATQLTINETSNTSFTGTINGSGSLVMAGPGTFTMNTGGTATYTGGTFITGGILQLGAPGALPTAGNLTVTSPGRFDMNSFAQTVGLLSGNGSITTGSAAGILTVLIPSGMSSTFSGVMSQSGSLVVGDGTARGTLILTGPNTYSGGTTVNTQATLQGNSTSLQGAIANNGNLIFNQTFSGTYSGALTGTGTLTLTGGSNLTLGGATPTQGNTIVNAGELIIGSGVTLTSPVTVNPSGALGPLSTGTIIGNVNVNGTTILGLGTLKTTGTYTQSPGSTFDVEVTSSSSGLLANIGTVTLSGSPAINISFEPGSFAPMKTYTLITSTTPVSGTFAAPNIENPFFEGSLIYNALVPGSVQLVLKIGPFSNVIKGGNAGAIAECINLQAFPAEADILPIIDTLVFLPIKEVRKALDEMQPSQLKALSLTQENNLLINRSAISQHVDDFYKTDCNQAIADLYQWSVWGNFSGDFLRQEGQSENVGYSADTFGVTSGIDGQVSPNLLLGAALGYDYSWLDWSNSRGHGAISSIYLGPYFTWFNHRVFTNVSLLGSFNRYEASRHISFPSVDAHAKNHHNGKGLIGHFDIGVLLYPTTDMSFSPIIGLDYIHIWEQAYTEHGAPGLNMRVLSTQASLFRTELGLEIAKCAILVHNKWTHDLKLSWIHQFPMTGEHLKAQFAGVNCTYTVKGLEPNQDYLDIATGLTGFFMKDRLSVALRYEGKFGDGIRDNTAYAQITYRF
jgi:autotransporter-associated beta strand protein